MATSYNYMSAPKVKAPQPPQQNQQSQNLLNQPPAGQQQQQIKWQGGTLNSQQIQQQSAAANADWAKQNQAWAAGQGTAAQQAQGQGYMAQQGMGPTQKSYGAAQTYAMDSPIVGTPGGWGAATPGGSLNSMGSLDQVSTAAQAPSTPSPFTPPTFNAPAYNPPPPMTSPVDQYLPKDPNLFNPNAYVDNDAMTPNYLSQMIPLWQMLQNNAQYSQDSQQAAAQWAAEHGLNVNNTQFQQGLSTQQQQMAEWVAQQQAQQWQQQFGHTQYMDQQGLGLSQQQINNALTLGLGEQQTNKNIASIYGDAQMYGADKQLQGTLYASDQDRISAMHQADQQLAGTLGSANIYGNAQMYGADQQLAGTMGSAGLYSGAQRYQSDQELAAAKYQWDMQMRMNQAMMANNLQVANIGAYGRNQAPAAQWARGWN